MGQTEALALVFMLLAAKSILPYPADMVATGQTAGWLLVILHTALQLALVLALIPALARYPGRGLAELNQEVCGPVLGTALNGVVLAWLLANLAMVLRLFTEAFITAILPGTPPGVIALAALGAALYGASGGLEVISRANLLLTPLIAAGFLAVLVFNLDDVRFQWLLPFWGPGPDRLAVAAVQHVGYMGEVSLLLLYAYALRTAAGLRRVAIWGLALGGLALAALTAMVTAVFGVGSAVRQALPLFSLAQMVYLGRFFQRAESLFVLLWALAAMIYLATLLHAAGITAAAALGVPYFRPLLWPLAALALAISLVPGNFTEALVAYRWVQSAGWVPAVAVPAVALALARRGVVARG